MNLEDLTLEYKEFSGHMYDAYFILSDMVKKTYKIQKEYSLSETYCDYFFDKFEENLLYMERFLDIINSFFDEIDCVSFDLTNKNSGNEKKFVKMDDYILIPDDYDNDIYVEPDIHINIAPRLKLCKNNITDNEEK